MSLLPTSAFAQDFMKMMQPYHESQAELDAVALVKTCDDAILHQDKVGYDRALLRLRAANPKKSLQALLRSQQPQNRAYAVMGFRILPIMRAWEDMRFMLMDSAPQVRWQVMQYAALHPKGINLDSITMTLQDPVPEVRAAAINAVMAVSTSKAKTLGLLRQRWKDESEPNVQQRLKAAFTVLGERSPDAAP